MTTTLASLVDAARPRRLRHPNQRRRSRRQPAADRGTAAPRSQRRPVRLEQDVGMGWNPAELGVGHEEFLILSTAGRHSRSRRHARSPWAITPATGKSACSCKAAAEELRALGCVPFAGFCTDPCDGRTQGTAGMMDSLPYRNDAALVLRRLIRSLPTRGGRARRGHLRQGTAGHDDGPGRRCTICPASWSPAASRCRRPTARTPARFRRSAPASPTASSRSKQAAELGCRACASPGGGCQFLGTAATSQVVGEALGLTLPHSRPGAVRPADLARHGPPLGPGRGRAAQRAA